jgi:hypothetical protein
LGNLVQQKHDIRPNEIQKSPAELEQERELEKLVLGDHGIQNKFEREIMNFLPGLVNETYENRITVMERMMLHLNIPHEDISTRQSNRLKKQEATINIENLPRLERKRLEIDTGPELVNDQQTEDVENEDHNGAKGAEEIIPHVEPNKE